MSELEQNDKYVIQIEHQQPESSSIAYLIKDSALTARVGELEDRLENYHGQIEIEELPTANGSYWITSIDNTHYLEDETTQFSPILPGLLIVSTENSVNNYTLITADGKIWLHSISNEKNIWINKWDNYYTKAEVDALLQALEDRFNNKLLALQNLVDALSAEIDSLTSKVNAIGVITGGSNPLNANILIMGENTAFEVDGVDVNVAQLVQEKLNLVGNNGVVWISNTDSKALYSYLQYSQKNFDGILLHLTETEGWYSSNISNYIAAQDNVILPFSSFAIIIYITNPGDIAGGYGTVGGYVESSTITAEVTDWQDSTTTIQVDSTDITPQIPVSVRFSSSTLATVVQSILDFIQNNMTEGAILKLVTPITWNKNGQTKLTDAENNLSKSLWNAVQDIGNNEKLSYKSIYCINELTKNALMAADTKTVTSQPAIDNYISDLCSFIQESKNNNATFTPVNLSNHGTIALKIDPVNAANNSTNNSTINGGATKTFTMATSGSGTISATISENRRTSDSTTTVASRTAEVFYKINNNEFTRIGSAITTLSTATKTRATEISWNANDIITIQWAVQMTAERNTTDTRKIYVNYPYTISIITGA